MTEIDKNQEEALQALPVPESAVTAALSVTPALPVCGTWSAFVVRSACGRALLEGERRSFAWILAPVAAALLVAWGSTISLATAKDFPGDEIRSGDKASRKFFHVAPRYDKST